MSAPRVLRSRRGMLLLEAVIAMFLFTVVIVSVMALISSARQLDRSELEPRELAAQAIQDARQSLANYVSASYDPGLAGEFAPAPGGPGSESWSIPGDSCAHAFEAGCVHNATRFLPPDFSVALATACLTYTVSPPAGEDFPTKVEFKLSWRDDRCVPYAKP